MIKLKYFILQYTLLIIGYIYYNFQERNFYLSLLIRPPELLASLRWKKSYDLSNLFFLLRKDMIAERSQRSYECYHSDIYGSILQKCFSCRNRRELYELILLLN